MRVAGLAVAVPSKGRPAVFIVVMDSTSPTAVTHSEAIPSVQADLPQQIHDAAEAVRSRLKGLGVDRAVVRRADVPVKPSKFEGPRIRLLMEGAITSAARSVVVDTRLGTGRELAVAMGVSKATVDAAALAATTAAGLRSDQFGEATAAAHVGLSI